MPDDFPYDAFLSHSAKDQAVVRPLAERLRAAGLLNNSQPSTFNSQPPRGSDWAQLESGAFGRGNVPFRDPLNQERRFLPLRLDDAHTNGSDWFHEDDDVRSQGSGATWTIEGNPQGERGGVHQCGVPLGVNLNH